MKAPAFYNFIVIPSVTTIAEGLHHKEVVMNKSIQVFKDMRRDKEHFPDSSDRDEIAGYLFSRGACSECLQIFRTCYKRYELYEQKHNRKS